MSHRRFHDPSHHAPFAFSAASEEQIAWWERKYPSERRQSTVIPALWITQKQNNGWLSEPALRAVAERLGMTYIRVYEVATFYTMFNLEPVGKYHFQVCGTTPCQLRGADKLKDFCERKIGPKGHVSGGGKFSWVEVECLGACVNAPMIQINDYYYEDLTPETMAQIIDDFAAGKTPKPGSYIGRTNAAPAGGAKTLLDPKLYDGSAAKPIKKLPNSDPAPAEKAPA